MIKIKLEHIYRWEAALQKFFNECVFWVLVCILFALVSILGGIGMFYFLRWTQWA